MTAIPCDFSSACGVADHSHVIEIKRLNNSRQIVGISIHVVSGQGLTGPPVATSIATLHPSANLRARTDEGREKNTKIFLDNVARGDPMPPLDARAAIGQLPRNRHLRR